MQPNSTQSVPDSNQAADVRLSYKFQRLREKLRAAIDSGELSGKLPGERQLARRFRVNAKTLSKALTDLAAEGVLERSIGRGTFVRRADGVTENTHAQITSTERLLVLCDPDQVDSPIIAAMREASPGLQVMHDTESLRPSFLHSFKAVINLAESTPQVLLRDLIVRNISVVLVGREPRTYSMNAVLVDRVLGASCLARDLMLAGHRKFVAVERRGGMQISDAIRKSAERYAPESTVDLAFPAEALTAVEMGATAVICDLPSSAAQVREELEKAGLDIPAKVSLAAVGAIAGTPPCSGHFVSCKDKVEAILRLAHEGSARRPNTVWLAGTFTDAGTIKSLDAVADRSAQRAHVDERPMLSVPR